MGKVVALSSFESHRNPHRHVVGAKREPAEVIMFTGVRYEPMVQGKDARQIGRKPSRSNIELNASTKP